MRSGYLTPVLPRVYAVGHVASGEHARLFSLILFAGPQAALSHATCAHWRGWLRYPAGETHVSTPRHVRTRVPGAVFHVCRDLKRELVDGIPCTTVAQTLLDLAATEPAHLVQRALAQLDYERRLNPKAIRAACGRGRPGSGALRAALQAYIPATARTRSELEDSFLRLCARHGIPLPEVNARVHGIEVDAHWPGAALVVELDGSANHHSAAQRNRDQSRALKLRAHGVQVVRYTNHQVRHEQGLVAADLLRELARRHIC
ncbi:MAG TPA: DUF559 domain-containing protein [Solirubrobacteraceae bacterium]|nr:DUF559 domain-containing protein [Solirubrobacteraceae bacterium]